MEIATVHHSITAELNVLVVDDSPATARAVCSFLNNEAGLRVVGVARSGAEALEMVSALVPDLMLLDLFMPGMSGLQAISAIKARSPGTRIIIVTVLGEDMIGDCRALGADGFVVKNRLEQNLLPEIKRVFSANPASTVFPRNKYRLPEIAVCN